MSTRPLTLVAVAGLVFVIAGCRLSTLSLSYHEDSYDHRPAHVTYVEPHVTHVCTHDCYDHFYDGTRVVVLRDGHRHGHDCGHHWDGRFWVAAKVHVTRRRANVGHARPVRPSKIRHGGSLRGPRVHVGGSPRVGKVKHLHGPSCGHVYKQSGHKWLKVQHGHVHGSGCGHVHLNGRWSIRF